MRAIQLHFLFILAACFAFSCNLSDDEKDTIVNVDPEFYISMFETLGPTSQFQFHLQTFSDQDCLNSVIDNSVVAQAPNITLYIKDVETLSDCNPGTAPALGIATAGRLQLGIYDLRVTLKNAVESTGRLRVFNDRYEILMETKNGIETTESTLYRIPEMTIWGYVAYDDPMEVGDEPQRFLNDLLPLTNPSGLNEGYFGHFSISNGQISELYAPPVQANVMPFHFSLASEWSAIKDLVDGYRNGASGNALKIKIFAWDGTVL